VSSSSPIKQARKVLRNVQELHLRGYQRIRISPFRSPSGFHWRCLITPASNILVEHGAEIANHEGPIALYTTGMEKKYFEWTDAAGKTASQLANIFIERFPEIARAGRGRDWSYAGWYAEMLHLTYPDHVPELHDIAEHAMGQWIEKTAADMEGKEVVESFDAYTDPSLASRCIPTSSPVSDRVISLPMPPPGEAAARA
jgi:hypothetical protein